MKTRRECFVVELDVLEDSKNEDVRDDIIRRLNLWEMDVMVKHIPKDDGIVHQTVPGANGEALDVSYCRPFGGIK